ncbi:MAG: GTPase Era [bacterium]
MKGKNLNTENKDINPETVSGFVSVCGRPNVGKSSLVNALIDENATIVSDEARTTLHSIPCIRTENDRQIIYVDTPGIHRPRGKIGEAMNSSAYRSWEDADIILFVVDLKAGPGPGDEFIADRLQEQDTHVIVAANKSDTVSKQRREELIGKYEEMTSFTVLPVSARQSTNLDQLQRKIVQFLSPGPQFYDRETTIGRPLSFQCSERIRQPILELTQEEVPHSTFVTIDRIADGDDPGYKVVEATIHVERQSQKGIIIGKGGQKIREIGKRARPKLEELLDADVYLDLFVTVEEDWTDRDEQLEAFGIIET